MGRAAGQALAILALSAVAGLLGNRFREEPLPFEGSLGPPPEPEIGADLPGVGGEVAMARWREGAFFLDARDALAWEGRRVSGAFSLPADDFQTRYLDVVAGFGTELPLFVYGAGADSHAVRRVVAQLAELGHSDVSFCTGGLDSLLAWGLGAAEGPEG